VLRGLSVAVPLVSFECNLPEFTEETWRVWRAPSVDAVGRM